jgi:hypothetical protein
MNNEVQTSVSKKADIESSGWKTVGAKIRNEDLTVLNKQQVA